MLSDKQPLPAGGGRVPGCGAGGCGHERSSIGSQQAASQLEAGQAALACSCPIRWPPVRVPCPCLPPPLAGYSCCSCCRAFPRPRFLCYMCLLWPVLLLHARGRAVPRGRWGQGGRGRQLLRLRLSLLCGRGLSLLFLLPVRLPPLSPAPSPCPLFGGACWCSRWFWRRHVCAPPIPGPLDDDPRHQLRACQWQRSYEQRQEPPDVGSAGGAGHPADVCLGGDGPS